MEFLCMEIPKAVEMEGVLTTQEEEGAVAMVMAMAMAEVST